MGHKGSVLRHRCIGAEGLEHDYYSILFYAVSTTALLQQGQNYYMSEHKLSTKNKKET